MILSKWTISILAYQERPKPLMTRTLIKVNFQFKFSLYIIEF